MARRLALLASLFFATAGCYSKATGYDGKLTVAYAGAVEVENFVKPIRPGAKLEVLALANGTNKELTIKSARSSKPAVVAVDAVRGHRLTLKGGRPGTAEIEITAEDESGAVLVDKMFFHVAAPATHELRHDCTEAAEAAYVRGADIDILHKLRTKDGRNVIGYGSPPLEIDPPDALKVVIDPQADGFYRLQATSSRPRVTIRSKVDDKTLTLRIVERRDLTNATLSAPDTMVVGERAYAIATVSAGEVQLCNQDALTTAKSLTPDVCSVTAKLDDDPGEESNRWQLAEIDAHEFGVCKYEVVLGELAGGKGVVLRGETKIGRVEYPGERDRLASLARFLPPLALFVIANQAFGGALWLAFARRRRRPRKGARAPKTGSDA